MTDCVVHGRCIGALLVASCIGLAFDAVALPACDSSQRYPRSLATRGIKPLVYPDKAFAAGIEGTFVYQFTVNDKNEIVPRCLVSGTGSDDLDSAMLERLSHATAILPRNSSSSPGTVYQESYVASLVRESELRDAIHESGDGVQAFRPELARHVGQPMYPIQSIEANEEGDVSVIANFSDRGEAFSVWVVKSSGYGMLDRAAMIAMLETQLNLRSSSVRVQRTFAFRLSGKSSANPAKTSAAPASAASAN